MASGLSLVQMTLVWCTINHLLWSTLAVSSRYLQVYATPQKFNGMTVLAVSKAASALLLWLKSRLYGDDCDDDHAAKSARGPGVKLPSASTTTRLVYALSFGLTASCRACLNIASMKYTLAYNISKFRWCLDGLHGIT